MLRWKAQLFMGFICFVSLVYTKCWPCRSANNQVSNEIFKPGRRMDVSREDGLRGGNATSRRPKKRCCPYEFNSTMCKLVDDRILCGYDTNRGRIKSRNILYQLTNDCRLRNSRIECGYQNPIYTTAPRKKVHGENPYDNTYYRDYPSDVRYETTTHPVTVTEIDKRITKGEYRRENDENIYNSIDLPDKAKAIEIKVAVNNSTFMLSLPSNVNVVKTDFKDDPNNDKFSVNDSTVVSMTSNVNVAKTDFKEDPNNNKLGKNNIAIMLSVPSYINATKTDHKNDPSNKTDSNYTKAEEPKPVTVKLKEEVVTTPNIKVVIVQKVDVTTTTQAVNYLLKTPQILRKRFCVEDAKNGRIVCNFK